MHDENCEAGLFLCWKSFIFSSIQSIILAIWAHHQLDNIRARHLGTIPYLVKLVVRSEKILKVLFCSWRFCPWHLYLAHFEGFLEKGLGGILSERRRSFEANGCGGEQLSPEPRVPWKSASQVGATTALAWTRSRKDSPRMVPKIFSRLKLIEMNRNFGHYTIFCRAVRAQFFEHVSPFPRYCLWHQRHNSVAWSSMDSSSAYIVLKLRYLA